MALPVGVAPNASAQTVAIQNVTVIAMTGAPPAVNQTVVVRDGYIAEIRWRDHRPGPGE